MDGFISVSNNTHQVVVVDSRLFENETERLSIINSDSGWNDNGVVR